MKLELPRRTSFPLLLGALLALVFWPDTSIQAHEGATGVVKERMRMMKSMAEGTKGMADMLKGKTSIEAAWIAGQAEAIAHDAAKLVDLFPEGSLKHPSEALPEVWQDNKRFVALSAQLASTAKSLGEEARKGDISRIASAFSKVAKTCKSCHSDFRKKK